jgi:hypothetical protein
VIKFVRLGAGGWFSPGTPVSFTIKTDSHNIAEMLLKVALNTITLSLYFWYLVAIKTTKFDLMFVLHIIIV